MKKLYPIWFAIGLSCAHASAGGDLSPELAPPTTDATSPTPPTSRPGAPAASAGDRPSPAPAPFAVWRARDPIYELYVRHFSAEGNFAAVTARLPELAALGVGILWLLPVHEIGSIVPSHGGVAIDAPYGNPYAVRSYEKLNPEYGTDADLRHLVDRAHELGLHVILDWVPNHTAWDNPLIETHPEFYEWKDGAIRPVSAEFPWIAQLDWSNPELATYMTNVMAEWVDKFDLDGFRIDYAHSMPLGYFDALRARLEEKKPVFLLAESGDVTYHPTFDMTYDWDVYPRFGAVARGDSPPSSIDDALLHTQLIPYASQPNALVMRMTYNHDDNGKFTLQAQYRGGIKTFAVLACTLPGTPLVFDGQEVGMNVWDGHALRPSANLGHDPAVKIDWTDPDGYRPFYTKLLHLRRANRALAHLGMADFRKVDTSDNGHVYAFVRRDGQDRVLVVLNLSDRALPEVHLSPAANAGDVSGAYVELFSGATADVDATTTLTLPPWGYRVYVQGPVDAAVD